MLLSIPVNHIHRVNTDTNRERIGEYRQQGTGEKRYRGTRDGDVRQTFEERKLSLVDLAD